MKLLQESNKMVKDKQLLEEIVLLKLKVKDLEDECKDACNTIIRSVEENNQLRATIEILKDKNLTRNLVKAYEEFKKGKGYTEKEVFTHLRKLKTKKKTGGQPKR